MELCGRAMSSKLDGRKDFKNRNLLAKRRRVRASGYGCRRSLGAKRNAVRSRVLAPTSAPVGAHRDRLAPRKQASQDAVIGTRQDLKGSLGYRLRGSSGPGYTQG